MLKAVAFDIDGTLYHSFSFYMRCLPFCVRHLRFMLVFGDVRKELRKLQSSGVVIEDIYTLQAELIAKKLNKNPLQVKDFINQKIYLGWFKFFKKIKLCKGAFETVQALKNAGLKIGLLSDFPPSQKNDVWGIAPLCDAVLGAENCGALKPDKKPFLQLAKELNVQPDEVLYVGNNYEYDILGAKNVGMKTAFFCNKIKAKFFTGKADIVFSNYWELEKKIKELFKI